jgi:hypothetical protein
MRGVQAEAAEAHVLASLMVLTADRELLELAAKEVMGLAAAEPSGHIKRSEAAIDEQIRRLVRLYQQELKTDAEFERELAVLRAERATLSDPPSGAARGEQAVALLHDVPTLLAQATTAERRAILQELFDTISLAPHYAVAARPTVLYANMLKALDARAPSAFHKCVVQWAGWVSGLNVRITRTMVS